MRWFTTLSVLLYAVLLIITSPAAAQEIKQRFPEGHPAHRVGPNEPGVEIRSPFRQGRRQEAAPRAGRSRLTEDQSEANLVMRANAGLTGVGASSTSIADIDGDGNQDLLITGEDANGDPTATLYLGDGQGGFTEADASLTGVSGGSTSIADVDGDGNQDLLITGEGANGNPTATLYLGDGQGGFSEAGAGLTGVSDGSTSIADVDGDGNQDLLITGDENGCCYNGKQTATLYLGDGQGGFSEAGAGLTKVGYGSSTSIADVDGDGNQDLLITGDAGNFNPTATLYLGDGQGGFAEADAGLTGVYSSSTSIADVDGDGNQDLLITGFGDNGRSATLYLGDGQGGFTEARSSLTGTTTGSTSIADIDGDGNQDLLITGQNANGDTATLYLGDGQGGFAEANAGLTGVSFGSASIADIGGDGDLDLLVTGSGALSLLGGLGVHSARIYINRQTQSPPNRAPTFAQTFSYDRTLAPGVTLRRAVEAGDLDGDLLSIGLASGPSNVSVEDRGNGTAEVAFTPIQDQGGDMAQFSIAAGDPSGAVGSFSVSVDVSPVLSAFSASLTGVDDGSTSIADVDGDGAEDLLITGEDENVRPTATLYLRNSPVGFVEADVGLTGVSGGSTSIADVDGDGNQDLLITGDSNSDGTATLYLGDGEGGFTEAGADLTGVNFSSTSIADIDGDGNQDLLITGGSNSGRTATLYLGDGQGGFTEAGTSLTGVSASSTSIADIDGDGNLDLLITGENASDNPTATLYLGDGQGGFTEANAGLTGTAFGSTSIADVDGDGNQDLLITGQNANFDRTATLYLGDGQGGFTEADAGLAGTNGSTSIADIDGDTDPDLLVTGFSVASLSRSAILYENLFDNPLPVELAGFEARVDGGKVRLTWTTASETGNAGFRVQRRVGETTSGGETASGGNGTWEQIGQVEGSGTTTEATSYRFTDANLPYEADWLEYRLKQVDTDGSASYTDPVAVERSVDEVELLGTYPNPARSQATVRYALPEKQEVTVKLYDMLGRKVRTIAEGKRKGRQKRQVDVSGLPSGAYFLRLSADGQTRTQRLTVVR